MRRSYLIFLVVLFAVAGIVSPAPEQQLQVAPDIDARLAKLPQVVIDYDHKQLNPEQQKVVGKLIEASKYIDAIFYRQVSDDNPAVHEQLTRLAGKSGNTKQGLRYFEMMKGRWDRLQDDEPFISPFGDRGKKPAGAGFYPADMSKDEFEKWVSDHPDNLAQLQSLYTVIRRKDGNLVPIPYSAEYRQFLTPAAERLKEAAAITTNESLKTFLLSRAAAFLSNEYNKSDIDWVKVDSPVEVTIGPYEVYEDGLLNMKSSFEAYVTVVDQEQSEKLKIYAKHLPDMERYLPEQSTWKNPARSTVSPVRVVDEVFSAGDGRAGVHTAAYNLPNDDTIRKENGSKNVLLKNVIKAKFDLAGEPIGRRVLDPSQLKQLSFEAYFNHILFHELSHALGPGIIKGPDGRVMENRIYLQDLYSTIEECKADVLGIWNLLYAIDEKLITSFTPETLYITDAGLLFRGMRFGVSEAHGGGAALEWNWYREKQAIVPMGNGKFKVDPDAYHKAVESLANELLTIEATGDYPRAQTLLKTYARTNKEIEAVTAGLKDLPVDIDPVYPSAGEKKR